MPGAGGASSATPRPGPQRRLFTTVPTYRTIDPPLKKMLNLLEENENDPPAVVYAEKLDQRVFGGRQFQQLFQQTGSSVAGLLARVQMVGGIVNQVTQEKANVEIALEFVSDDDAKNLTPDDYWICACVKRDKAGNLKAIRRNHPSVKKCPGCGCIKKNDAKGAGDE